MNEKFIEILQKYGNDHFRLNQLVCRRKRGIKIIEIRSFFLSIDLLEFIDFLVRF